MFNLDNSEEKLLIRMNLIELDQLFEERTDLSLFEQVYHVKAKCHIKKNARGTESDYGAD